MDIDTIKQDIANINKLDFKDCENIIDFNEMILALKANNPKYENGAIGFLYYFMGYNHKYFSTKYKKDFFPNEIIMALNDILPNISNRVLKCKIATCILGIGTDLYALPSVSTAAEWKFQKRADGSFNIVNRADGAFVSPVADYNTALKMVKDEPADGWTFGNAATANYYTITSGTTEMNQTRAVLNYKVYNWGEGTNTTDTGCQFFFYQVAHEHHPASGIDAAQANAASHDIRVVDRRIVTQWPYRLYSATGQSLPVGRQLKPGIYMVKTCNGCQKIVVD